MGRTHNFLITGKPMTENEKQSLLWLSMSSTSPSIKEIQKMSDKKGFFRALGKKLYLNILKSNMMNYINNPIISNLNDIRCVSVTSSREHNSSEKWIYYFNTENANLIDMIDTVKLTSFFSIGKDDFRDVLVISQYNPIYGHCVTTTYDYAYGINSDDEFMAIKDIEVKTQQLRYLAEKTGLSPSTLLTAFSALQPEFNTQWLEKEIGDIAKAQ